MSLKKAIVSFTDKHGDRVTRELSIRAVVFDFANSILQVMFWGWPSVEAREAGAEPFQVQQNIAIDMTDPQDGGLIGNLSEAIWDKIVVNPLIPDYSEKDDDGKMVKKDKTLQDLNAEIVVVAENRK